MICGAYFCILVWFQPVYHQDACAVWRANPPPKQTEYRL